MATVFNSLLWASYEQEVRARIGVLNGLDDRLSRMFSGSKTAADTYINEPWVDADGVDITIPDGVVEGVLVWMTTLWGAIGPKAPAPNVTSVRIGDNSINYAGSNTARIDPAQLALQAAASYWAPYQIGVWR